MGTHLIVLGKSFQMNTNMIGFRCLHSCALDKNNLSIGGVKHKYGLIQFSDEFLFITFEYWLNVCEPEYRELTMFIKLVIATFLLVELIIH